MEHPHHTYSYRQKKIQKAVEKLNTDSFIITYLPHIRYLTGFSGSSAILLLTNSKYVFFTDFRYEQQVKEELKLNDNLEVVIIKDGYLQALIQYLSDQRIKSVLFQSRYLSCFEYADLKRKLPVLDISPDSGICEDIIIEKSDWEIERIAKAASISDELFNVKYMHNWYRQDISENVIAAKMEYQGRVFGAESVSFPTIVASGKNSAIVHAQTTDTIPKNGDMILSDYGQKYKGYCSDMTRTVFLGSADKKFKEIYSIVLEAQLAALEKVKSGVSCSNLDKTARDIITSSGYGEYFGHGLGHGVGIEVHEGPKISASSDDVLAEGMVITIEPGIYIPGWGGIRIEDLVVVKKDGYKRLSLSDKSLIEIN